MKTEISSPLLPVFPGIQTALHRKARGPVLVLVYCFRHQWDNKAPSRNASLSNGAMTLKAFQTPKNSTAVYDTMRKIFIRLESYHNANHLSEVNSRMTSFMFHSNLLGTCPYVALQCGKSFFFARQHWICFAEADCIGTSTVPTPCVLLKWIKGDTVFQTVLMSVWALPLS